MTIINNDDDDNNNDYNNKYVIFYIYQYNFIFQILKLRVRINIIFQKLDFKNP